MLILYIFLLLCGTVSAQQTVEWNDLQPLTDDAHRTVYYKKDSKRPLQGKYRIIRGLDEEHVKLSDGMINGDYHRYRDGVLRESGIYVKGKRNGTFTEYYLYDTPPFIGRNRPSAYSLLPIIPGTSVPVLGRSGTRTHPSPPQPGATPASAHSTGNTDARFSLCPDSSACRRLPRRRARQYPYEPATWS